MIIASILSTAVAIPINICALSSVFLRSNLILLSTVFSLKETNCEMNSFRLSIFGFPSTIAKVLKPKEDSTLVNL